jgi:chemotaxis protein methyltransferase WspC
MSVNTAAMREIADALADASGIDTRALDANRMQWIIDARCRARGLKNAEAYAASLALSPDELDLLIDAAVVPETRFFRDKAVFEQLLRWLPQFAAELSGELRILSAPCSTGQEAYSVAATFRQAGILPSRFTITAVDLSQAALRTAKRGTYPEEAMRRLTSEQQEACGSWDGTHWKMHAASKRSIEFKRLNLADPGALGDERYHLILCRNLFIYLRPEARRALAQSLAAALLPGGRLILGTADHMDELNAFFSPLKPAASFAFTHRSAKIDAEPPAVSSKRATTLIANRPHRKHAAEPEAATTMSAVHPTATTLLRSALQHEQHGDLLKAEHRCRQALYLDPGYLPALELLETLWRHLPDQRLRRALTARIIRSRTSTLEETR